MADKRNEFDAALSNMKAWDGKSVYELERLIDAVVSASDGSESDFIGEELLGVQGGWQGETPQWPELIAIDIDGNYICYGAESTWDLHIGQLPAAENGEDAA